MEAGRGERNSEIDVAEEQGLGQSVGFHQASMGGGGGGEVPCTI